jgi:hypothetical protein
MLSSPRAVFLFTRSIAFCVLWPTFILQGQSGLSLQEGLIAADRGIWGATAGPHPQMGQLQSALAPEFILIKGGETESRDQVMKFFARATDLKSEYRNPRAVVLTPNMGYVIADVRASYPSLNGAPRWEHALTATVFTRRDGEWVATLRAETPIEDSRDEILAKPSDSNPDLIAMRSLATKVMLSVRVPGYAPFPFYPVSLDAGAAISYSDGKTAHEANFTDLPLQMRQFWNQWATYTKDEPSGEALFKDMFYRFFLVHELGHLIAGRVIAGLPEAEKERAAKNLNENLFERELWVNRVAAAWFREHDPRYLNRLVADFRLIHSHLPNPVPQGSNPKSYFAQNFLKLYADPRAFSWYQLSMVISVYGEPPRSFQQILDTLPKIRYDEE